MLIISLASNVVLIVTAIYLANKSGVLTKIRSRFGSSGDVVPNLHMYHKAHVGMYRLYKKVPATIVVLGDSLTEFASWGELLGRSDVINRGIPADTVSGFLVRINWIKHLAPKICLITGGINDITARTPVARIVNDYEKILDELMSSKITPIVTSTFSVARKVDDSQRKNADVESLNYILRESCTRRGVTFLDVNSLVSIDGYLGKQYTFDGVHLNHIAYDVWSKQLSRALLVHSI